MTPEQKAEIEALKADVRADGAMMHSVRLVLDFIDRAIEISQRPRVGTEDALKYLLIEYAQVEEPAAVTVFNTEADRIDGTRRAMFMDGDISGHEDEFAEAISTLSTDGLLTFEGDPPLGWLTAAISAMEPAGEVAFPRWQHVKRGSVYVEIGRAELQMSFDLLVDGSEMVVYRGDDGRLWCREVTEFEDGRFVPAPPIGEPANEAALLTGKKDAQP